LTAVGTIGVVVIGRNEGERLRRCLESVRSLASSTVYVDSASSDGSVELAGTMGVAVVRLDMSLPFTAARARNAGFKWMQQALPSLRWIQFVDGDCELIEGWVDSASGFLDQQPAIAVVCGRLRERFPERSVYNRLCDIEWDRPTGETDACGGIFMTRPLLFASLGGFQESLLAGEEPELCQRLRAKGWKIWRLARPMAWHDAAMLRFSQWWKRSLRTGFGYAQGAHVLGSLGERRRAAQLLRPWFWAALLPLATFGACVAWGAGGLLLLLAYPAKVLRTTRFIQGDVRTRIARAYFLTLGQFPELLGQLQFWISRRSNRGARSFDYKS
jgi:glycosyltransferase involved in cell wall biosynthesis